MSFTFIFALGSLVLLAVVFVIVYLLKGWKAALIATGVAFLTLAVLFAIMLYVIVNSM